MDPVELAKKVVAKMMATDTLSQWLGIEVIEASPGACIVRMIVREEMNNGFGITHGGITYCLADSALAFAANSHGTHAVSIETSVTHTRPVGTGDVITATAEEVSRTTRFATYHINILNAQGKCVALFKGTVFRKGSPWEV